jgi:hypothetical protein
MDLKSCEHLSFTSAVWSDRDIFGDFIRGQIARLSLNFFFGHRKKSILYQKDYKISSVQRMKIWLGSFWDKSVSRRYTTHIRKPTIPEKILDSGPARPAEIRSNFWFGSKKFGSWKSRCAYCIHPYLPERVSYRPWAIKRRPQS